MRLSILSAAVLTGSLACCLSGCQGTQPEGRAYWLAPDGLAEGELPKGWKVAATNPGGELAEWKAVADDAAAGRALVLSVAKITDASKGHFNLCWTDAVQFRDGTLAVDIRANSGAVDQGGGLMWRVRDANNYYVARYNPLESNFRLYHVKDGKRVQLADAGGIKIKAGEWFTMKVVVAGDRMEAWLGDKKLLEATDRTFPEAGGVGFWTKADAASSFHDLTVEPPTAVIPPGPKGGHHIQTYAR